MKSGWLSRRCPNTDELEEDIVVDSSASSNRIVDRDRSGANSKGWQNLAYGLASKLSSYTTATPTTSIP